jgi:hypothetical protein
MPASYTRTFAEHTMITRRGMTLGGMLTLSGGYCRVCAAAGEAEASGCVVAAEFPDQLFAGTPTAETPAARLNPAFFDSISLSSGNKALDYALAQTLARITDAFQVLPGFVFYRDRNDANSFATPRRRFPRTDGTILFGTRFLHQLLSRHDNPEIALTSICAHEFAHILQFKRGLLASLLEGQPTTRRCELHADFFAGYFAGMRKKEKPEYPAAVFAVTLSSLTTGANYRHHHGTPQQRAAAIMRGFEASYRERRSLDDAIDLSMTYAASV